MDLFPNAPSRERADDAQRGHEKTPSRKPSVLGHLWRGTRFVATSPIAAAGVGEVKQGARFIRGLAEIVRTGPQPDRRLRTHADRTLDLQATAFSHGLSVAELEQRLAARQWQTARAAYLAFALGWGFLGLWLYQALRTPWSYARVTSALEFMPFCAAFFLLAFRNAWLNWQLRTRRLGSAADYLRTSEPFWPS